MTCFDLVNGNDEHFKPDLQWQPSVPGFTNAPYRFQSELFKWKAYPVVSHLKLALNIKGVPADLSLDLQFQNKDKFLQMGHIPSVYYLIRDPNASTKPKCVNSFYLFKPKPDLNFDYNYILTKAYYEMGLKMVEVYVEDPFTVQHVHSYDGTLNWTISNFENRKVMERSGLINYQESPYFYTGNEGYRVQVHAYLEGTGADKQMFRVRVNFMAGKFDEDLTDSFPHITTVTIVNQHDNQLYIAHVVHQYDIKEKSYEMEAFYMKDILYAVENDTLVIKVKIVSLDKPMKH